MSMLLLLASMAAADGIPHNNLGLRLPPASELELARYDAAQVNRRNIDLLDPLPSLLDRRQFEEAREGWWFGGALAGGTTFGLGTVAAICNDTTLRTSFECPRNRNTRDVPIDSMHTTMAVAAHNGDFSLVYTGSSSLLQLEHRLANRPLFPLVYQMYGPLMPATMALDRAGITELLGFARSVHLVSGVYRPGEFEVRLGTTLELRPYLYAGHSSGAFLETMIRSDFSGTRVLKAGFDRAEFLPEDVGVTTARLNKIDLVDLSTLRDETTPANLDRLGEIGLWTVDVDQDNIAGLFDVHSTYAVLPTATLVEFTVGAHTPTWHTEPGKPSLRAYAGAIRLPQIPTYNATKSRSVTMGVDAHLPSSDAVAIDLGLVYNDPDILLELPWTARSLSMNFKVAIPHQRN